AEQHRVLGAAPVGCRGRGLPRAMGGEVDAPARVPDSGDGTGSPGVASVGVRSSARVTSGSRSSRPRGRVTSSPCRVARHLWSTAKPGWGSVVLGVAVTRNRRGRRFGDTASGTPEFPLGDNRTVVRSSWWTDRDAGVVEHAQVEGPGALAA